MSAYKKTDIDVAIVDWLQKNSNKENTFCIDEIIKQIYEVEDREFNELIIINIIIIIANRREVRKEKTAETKIVRQWQNIWKN